MNVVLPAITSRNPSVIAASVCASTDDVASSRIRIRGSASSPRDRHPLALAARQRQPPFADDGVVAVGQLADERVRSAARAAVSISSSASGRA